MQDRSRDGRQVAIVDIGNSNLVRLKYALQALGHQPRVLTSGSAIAEAPLAIVPGTGSLKRTLDHVNRSGLAEALKARGAAGLHTLAIGLGALLYCEGLADGEVSGPGMGYLPGIVRRLPDQGVKGEILVNPHVGWNKVKVLRPSPLLGGDASFYFAHDRVIDPGRAWDSEVLAQAEHTLVFPAVLKRGGLVGAQFHPELSGAAGLSFLDAFCRQAG